MNNSNKKNLCQCQVYANSSVCLCGLSQYKIGTNQKDAHNYLSYGKFKGKFQIEPDTLYDIIENNEYSKNYAFVEVIRSDFFKLYFDVDLKDKHLSKYDISEELIEKSKEIIIESILKTVKGYVKMDVCDYIYANKNLGHGIHLYFPDITISYPHVSYMITEINKNLTNCLELPQDIISKIMDLSVYKTGLRLIHQVKDGSYYKISKSRSTYTDIPKILSEQLKLTQINTSSTSTNFFPPQNINLEQCNPKKSINNKTKEIDETLQSSASGKDQENREELCLEDVHNLFNDEPYEQLEQQMATNDFSNDDIRKIVNMLSNERAEAYESWNEVGLCIHNINNDFMDFFLSFSKKSSKYDEDSCKKMWRGYSKMENGLNIGSLIMWAKNDNPIKYEKLKKKRLIKKIIGDTKINFPNNDISVKKIKDHTYFYSITLNDKYCPIYGGEHNNETIFMELNNYGLTLKCGNKKCIGQIFPNNIIQCPLKYIKNLFNTNSTNKLNIPLNHPNRDPYELTAVEIDSDVMFFDDKKLNKLIINSLNGTPYNIATCIYYMTGGIYRCTHDKRWYVFRNHRWSERDAENSLRRFISRELHDKYKTVKEYYCKKINEGHNKAKILRISRIMDSLETTNMKKNIIAEAYDVFIEYETDFEEKLDKDAYLLGFDNGIYDLRNKEFRDGKPEDYITLSCGYELKPPTDETKNKIFEMLRGIFPDESDRDYFMKYVSSALLGVNTTELFTIMTGTGANGKSLLMELLMKTFGGYCNSISTKLFTRPRPESTSPDPGLLNLYKSRLVMASEAEFKDKLNTGFIKMITGNDTVELRRCHSNDMVKFKANFKILIACNDIPDVDGTIDMAFVRRLRCINFPTTFTKTPKKENEVLINERLKEEIINWGCDFMHILIAYYDKFIKDGITPTSNIMKWTNKYRKENDLYLSYIDDRLVAHPDGKLLTKYLYKDFKEWFSVEYPSDKTPSCPVFKKGLKEHTEIFKCIRVGLENQQGIKGYFFKDHRRTDNNEDKEESKGESIIEFIDEEDENIAVDRSILNKVFHLNNNKMILNN